MSASSSYTSRAAGIGAGLVLLLTFVIPFAPRRGGGYVWAWDMLKTFGQLPVSLQGFLITAWAVGLLALLCGLVLRRMSLAVGYLMLGVGGAVALFTYFQLEFPLHFRSSTIHCLNTQVLTRIGFGTLAGFLVVTGIRARLGAGKFICTLQILLSAALGGLLGVCLYDGIRSALDTWPNMSAGVWRDTLFTWITQGMLALSALTAMLHAFAMRARRSWPTRLARRLALVVALLAIPAFPILAPVLEGQPPITFLPGVNLVVMAVCMLIVLLEGVTSVFSEIGAMISPPPAPAVSRESVMEQLRELDAARAHGAISAEEYNARRDKLLDRL